jgi:microcystin-dependent protein
MSIDPPRYRVYLRDSTYAIVDELDNWLRLDLVIRFNGIGSWALEIANDVQSVASVILQRSSGIVVRRDNETIFSGSVNEIERTALTIRASGNDDMALLKSLALPSPIGSPPYVHEYNVVTGTASSVMAYLVNYNIGPGGRADRKVDALTMGTDPLLGSTITARGRFQPLIALLAELAITPYAGGLGFKLVQSDTVANTVEFTVFAPADRSEEAKFGVELGTAADYSDLWTAPTANAIYVGGGDGLGLNRSILEDEDATSIADAGRRIEAFIDRRSVSDLGELNQALAEAMASTSSSQRVGITPIDVPSLEYGTDWDLGDLVTFASDRGIFVDLVREVSIELIPDRGAIVKPLIGQQGASGDDPLSVHVQTVSNRLSNIERNWNVPDDSVTDAMLHEYVKWEVGDYKPTARDTAQPGWLLCHGQAVSRETYEALFDVIGETYGVGDGSTTFNVPSLQAKFPLGTDVGFPIGQVGGADTISGLAHTHAHSHGGGGLTYTHTHAGQTHTHPGSHTHDSGTLAFQHTHDTDINHDHGSFSSGDRNNTTPGGAFRWDEPNVSSGTEDHHHAVDVPALGSTVVESSGWENVSASGSTGSDTNAPAASYSGSAAGPSGASWSGGSDSDSSAANYSSGSASIIPPYLVVEWMIYAGA